MSASDALREFLRQAAPDIVAKLDAKREQERQDVVAQAEDAVYLIVRDVRKHWATGDCDGDRSCLGGAFSSWAADAEHDELSVVLGRAVAMLAELLPENIDAQCSAALARDEQRERDEDAITEQARDALPDDADGALVVGPFAAGEAPDLSALDLGDLLRGES